MKLLTILFLLIPASYAQDLTNMCVKEGLKGTLVIVDCQEKESNLKISPLPSSGGGTIPTTSDILTSTYHRIPFNQVVFTSLELGKTYDGGAAVTLGILPSSDPKGFSVLVQPKVQADTAIVEVYYRTVMKAYGRDVTYLRHLTLVDNLFGNKSVPIEVDMSLSKVEKINVRLLTEEHVTEFWGDSSGWIDSIEKKP